MAVESSTNPTPLPPTPDGWREMQIDELCERVTSGGTPSRQRPDFYENGVFSWFKTKELNDCALYDSEERITQEALDSSSAKLFPPNTILMAMYGDGVTITSLGILRREAATNQACCAMIPKSTLCEPRFLFYSLLNHREDFIRIASGGAQRNLSGSLIRRFALNAPPLAEQKAIAAVLGALDDKIELNRRMNATLEAMARALFQSWFVDFDPVRAKLDNRQPIGLDKATADLFPAAFQESVIGPIPQRWEVGRLDDVLTLQRGFDLPTPDRTHGKYPVMAASGPNGCHDKFMVRGPGVTTGRSGVLGRVFFIHGDFWPLNTSLWVKEFKRVSPVYTFHLLRGLDFEMFNAGSAVPTLNRNHVHNLPVVMPPKPIIEALDAQVMPLMKQQKANEDQSRTLATLRDTLLPMLLSGELRVTDAETMAVETV